MKTLLAVALLTAASFASALPAFGQDVSTGMVQSVDPKDGILTIRSDQTHGAIICQNINRANIFTADGMALRAGQLQPGQRVTVEYAVRSKKWYISKIILSAPNPANPAGMSKEEIARIRESTEGETRTPSAEAKPTPGIPIPPVQTGRSYPVRRNNTP